LTTPFNGFIGPPVAPPRADVRLRPPRQGQWPEAAWLVQVQRGQRIGDRAVIA